jgi:chromosome segregation ATPase
MEAAKWTFTSAQLQEIVSRAIRQSAEASSIRLLRLEILDEELPQELQRLEAARSELKTRFKILGKRRNGLVSGLTMYVTGEEDGSAYGPRMIEELKEVNANLDKLTEDLHSMDDQISHLELLVQIHSGSALAMALRKLNTSFLKQVSENQTLRDRVQALEAERDEAWHQAENIATEIDSLHGRIDSAPSSKRSSRVSAVKKSSIRVSRAGLRSSGSRFSQLSSATSGVHIYGLTPRSPMPRTETIPPVPPVPRPRPTTISTDIPMSSPPVWSNVFERKHHN